jgi:hypothetical protein
MGKRIWSLIGLLAGIGIVVFCIVILMTYLPTTGLVKGEFMTYSDVRSVCFAFLGIGVGAGFVLTESIRGLLKD